MLDGQNMLDIAEQVKPDFMGFIFYEKSKRFFQGEIPALSSQIKKTGVFVNETLEKVAKIVTKHELDAVQLHGDESTAYCESIKEKFPKLAIIKVFSVGEKFDFNEVNQYHSVADFFLFDTKGKERGGNGITFSWEILKAYELDTPYFLSGGIGLEEADSLKLFFKQDYSKNCIGIDVNSQFEDENLLKKTDELRELHSIIKNI